MCISDSGLKLVKIRWVRKPQMQVQQFKYGWTENSIIVGLYTHLGLSLRSHRTIAVKDAIFCLYILETRTICSAS
jgi:hypothetical protein